jgi:energy-coupling factor transporter ATP-binding protein EcfA2
MADVVLRDVTKRYGDNAPVIAGVSLEIREHEPVVLVGRPALGDKVQTVVELDRVHLFDAHDEKRIAD